MKNNNIVILTQCYNIRKYPYIILDTLTHFITPVDSINKTKLRELKELLISNTINLVSKN